MRRGLLAYLDLDGVVRPIQLADQERTIDARGAFTVRICVVR